MTNPVQIPVCRTCKSKDVTKDAWAEWDPIKQDWVLHSTYDDEFCQTCEQSTKLDWVNAEFPFVEIKDENGDYFSGGITQVRVAGYDDNQIWSVTESDGTICYGPPHHYVNLLGHIATTERHDGNTYYEESDLT
jgi:hypothetical protein